MKMLRSITLPALFVAMTVAAGAQWRQAETLSGGTVHLLAATDAGLFGMLPGAHLHRYDPDAGRWSRRATIEAFRLDAVGGVLVASTENGLKRSVDAGRTWEDVGPGGGTAIATEGDVIYGVDRERMLRSTDFGRTWDRFADLGPNVIAVATLDSVVIVAVDREPGFVRSTDHGRSWRIVSEGLPANATATTLKRLGDDVYASMRDDRSHRNLGVYRSTDAGRSWSELNDGLPEGEGGRPWLHRLHEFDGRLHATSTYGLFRLDGDRWNRILDEPALAIASSDSGLFVGTFDGVLRRASHDAPWTSFNEGLTASTVNAIVSGNDVTIAASGFRVHRSTDDGAHWTPTLAGRAAQLVRSGDAIVARIDPYGDTALYRSTDDGATWTAATSGLEDPRSAVREIASDGPVMYAALHDIAGIGGGGLEWRAGGVFRSTDGGASWSPASEGLPRQNDVPVPVASIAASGASVVVASVAGVYRSSDRGVSWIASSYDPGNGLVSALGTHGGAFYISAGNRVLRSTDGGATWHRLGALQFERPVTSFHSVGPTLLALSRYSAPIRTYRLEDSSWTDVSDRLPAGVAPMTFATDGSELLLGTSDAGLWYGSLDVVAGASDDHTAGASARVVPSPATDVAALELTLARSARSDLEIVDMRGRVVARRDLGTLGAGDHRIALPIETLAPGVYHWRLRGVAAAGGFVKR